MNPGSRPKRTTISGEGTFTWSISIPRQNEAGESSASHRLLTTNYVLAEAYPRIRDDDGPGKALVFDALIQEMTRRRQLSIGWVTSRLPEEALALFTRDADHKFSIVDCASFVVARRRKVREVFGFDSDFAAMGFVLRPF